MELEALGVLQAEGDRVTLDGPPVRIRSSAVQTLALALHELATNARKYGALSNDERRVQIVWQLTDAGTRLPLEWLERGGLAPDPSARRGYGRELIEDALPYALDARTRYVIDPERVRCIIDMRISEGASHR